MHTAPGPPRLRANPSRPRRDDPELVQALERAGKYVAEYERSFSDIVVEETYTQDIVVGVQRTERSGLS